MTAHPSRLVHRSESAVSPGPPFRPARAKYPSRLGRPHVSFSVSEFYTLSESRSGPELPHMPPCSGPGTFPSPYPDGPGSWRLPSRQAGPVRPAAVRSRPSSGPRARHPSRRALHRAGPAHSQTRSRRPVAGPRATSTESEPSESNAESEPSESTAMQNRSQTPTAPPRGASESRGRHVDGLHSYTRTARPDPRAERRRRPAGAYLAPVKMPDEPP